MNFTFSLYERAIACGADVRMSTVGLRFAQEEGHIWAVLDWLRSTDLMSDLLTVLQFDEDAILNTIAEAQRRHFIRVEAGSLTLTALGALRAEIQDRVHDADSARVRLSKKDLETWLTAAISALPKEVAQALRGINLGKLSASLLVNSDPVMDLLIDDAPELVRIC